MGGPKIYRICDGNVQQPSERCWIGNPDLVREIEQAEIKSEKGLRDQGIPFDPERNFISATSSVVQAASHASAKVGGFIIWQLGSPWGHTYITPFGAAVLLENVRGGVTETTDQQVDRQSGKREYNYNIVDNQYRGAGVVGGYLEQGKLGYVYAPLILERPMRLHPITQEQMFAPIKLLSKQLGGTIEEKRWDE